MDLGVIILAIIQGIAEFLPISSSAHLIIFRDLFGLAQNTITGDMELAFDIALHFGTLLAIMLYFFKDWWKMVISGLTKGTKQKEGKLFWYIVLATIPAALAGVFFEETIENVVRKNYLLIGLALIFMGIVIYLVDKTAKQKKNLGDMKVKDALLIGCSQVFALIPGFSRSGTTIAAARSLSLNREDAAKFSFYLSAPVVCGAVVLSLFKESTILAIESNLSVFVVGVLVAFIAGLLCIEFLLKYIRKHDFKVFMWYRLILGLIVIGYVLF
jgi:undecaprenyl-diphosphatase uppP